MLPYGYQNLRLLIVDDEPATLRMLRAILAKIGLSQVTEATSVDQAVPLIHSESPDLVLTDWTMPGSSGLELVNQLRRDPDSPDPLLPIMLVTASADLEQVKAARDAGANGYLVKPFAPRRIAERILELVNSPRSFVVAPGYVGPDRRRVQRSVAVERRDPLQPAPGALLLPPDGLLAARVSGDEGALEEARRRRAGFISQTQQQRLALPQALDHGNLTALVSEALAAIDHCSTALAQLAGPLARARQADGATAEALPNATWAEPMLEGLSRITAAPEGGEIGLDRLRLYLQALELLRDFAAVPNAESQAADLVARLEALRRQ